MNISVKVKVLNLFRCVFKLPILERWLAANTLNKSPNHIICKLVPNPYQYAPATYRTIQRDHLTLEVDISDYIGHYLYFGFLDSAITELFSLCKPSDNVIDIGTNIGWTVLNFAKRSHSGIVIGFEPDPFNYRACQLNIARNTFPNLTVYPFGLGEATHQVMMELRTPENRGRNRVAPSGNRGSLPVPIRRLDEVAEVTSLSKIHLMKLDVEGYELKVLRGAKALLQIHKPILFIEVDDDNLKDQNDSAMELLQFLEHCGYRSFKHSETGVEITPDYDFSHCHFDIIAR
ncbi:MAG: FkbM family methyltransferase [Flammeovirgaceae bacterium]